GRSRQEKSRRFARHEGLFGCPVALRKDSADSLRRFGRLDSLTISRISRLHLPCPSGRIASWSASGGSGPTPSCAVDYLPRFGRFSGGSMDLVFPRFRRIRTREIRSTWIHRSRHNTRP